MRIVKYIFSCLCFLFMVSCMNQLEQKEVKSSTLLVDKKNVVAGINLTVSEGKRLIAKGIANMPQVRERMQKGIIIITRGTTNTYLAEELIGLKEVHGAFLTGHFVPEGVENMSTHVCKKLKEIVLVNGQVTDLSYEDGLKQLREGDLIFKGGNLLNYSKKQAAVCIGAPDGGTTYRLLPYVGEGKAQLIVPIGLEKESSLNLKNIESELVKENEKLSFVPKIHVYESGMIFTEIEAIRQFADVNVFPFGVGGIAGREGGLSLVVAGDRAEVEKVIALVKTVQGELPFDK